MKKMVLFAALFVSCFMAGCTNDNGSSSETSIENDFNDRNSLGSSEVLSDETNEFPPEEKIAPIIPLPSTRTYDPDVAGEIIEPLFELDGIAYEWDIKEGIWSFLIFEDGSILLETRDGLIKPSDYDNVDGDEIVAALSDINSLEYVGFAKVYDGALGIEEYLYRFGDKLLAYTPCPQCMEFSALLRNSDYDPNQYYEACMYIPCE
ncbi:MAG: hypothetical protein K2O14_04790 [Oscillospiraceae bacterium]|nr:hypothetical protein [Oscillospiraceae bacterium]